MRDVRVILLALLGAALAVACTNNPYPEPTTGEKVLYTNYQEPPKTLDPAVAYSTADHVITGAVYDTLLEYHFLDAPVPADSRAAGGDARAGAAGRRPRGLPLPAARGLALPGRSGFALEHAGRTTRPVVAADVAFQLMRMADPEGEQPGGADVRTAGGVRSVRRAARRRRARTIRLSRAAASTSSTPRPAASRACACSTSARSSWCCASRTRSSATGSRWSSPRRCRGRPSPTTTARTAATRFAEHPVGTGPFRLARLRQAAPHRARAQPELVRHPPSRVSRAGRRCIPTDGEPGRRRAGTARSGVRRDSRCRSSTASSSGSTRRTSPRSRSSCRATTTCPASSRRASIAWCTRAACRRRWRRSACGSRRRCSRRSTTSAST